jgi:hypothetical protein
MRFRLAALSALVLATAAAPAHAQTNFSSAGNLVTPTTVGYHFFQVTTAGTFDVFTTSITGSGGVTPFDPQIYLFSGSGTAGALLGTDDDGCSVALCGASATAYNALIGGINLGIGSYTVAVGDFFLSEEDARDGFNDNASVNGADGGAYRLNVRSDGGVATSVPEPSSVALLTAGLFGVAFAARRRRIS